MALRKIRNIGAVLLATSTLLLGACETTKYVQTPTDDPILVMSTAAIEGTPLSLAEMGGGPIVRVNPQGGAWLPKQNWYTVRAFADECRRDAACFTRAATKVYTK